MLRRIGIAVCLAAFILSFGGCGSETPEETTELALCAYCGSEIEAADFFCSNCGSVNDGGASLTSEPERVLIDYSDFGFDNMYGMTEWLRIDNWDLSDHSNAMVMSGYSDVYYVINFENGYIESRAFGSEYSGEYKGHFYGYRTEGTLDDTYPYRLVSNYVLELQTTNNRNVEIVGFEIVEGLPIIKIEAGSPAYFINGCYIPTDFIDWSREPVTSGDLEPITYYIGTEYFE